MDVVWSQVLENFLNSRGERTSWRVLNGGVVSYSGIQSVRRASRLLDVLKPDLILLFVSPGRQMLLSHVQGMRVEQIGDSRIPVDIVSATPSFLHPVLPWLLEILTTSSLYTRYRAALVADIHVPRSYRRYMLSRTPVPSVIEEVLEATFAEFQSLQEKCDRLGIEVRAVVIAEPSQGSEGRWERYLERENKTGAPRPGTDRREPNEVLEERLSAVGVDSWQFFEVIAAMGRQPDHYLCDNFHWSEAGHYLIAQRLLRQMSQEGFLNTLPRSREKKPRE